MFSESVGSALERICNEHNLDEGYRNGEEKIDLSEEVELPERQYFGCIDAPFDEELMLHKANIDKITKLCFEKGVIADIYFPTHGVRQPDFNWRLICSVDADDIEVLTAFSDNKAKNPVKPNGFYDSKEGVIKIDCDIDSKHVSAIIPVSSALKKHFKAGYCAKIKVEKNKAYWLTLPEYNALNNYESYKAKDDSEARARTAHLIKTALHFTPKPDSQVARLSKLPFEWGVTINEMLSG